MCFIFIFVCPAQCPAHSRNSVTLLDELWQFMDCLFAALCRWTGAEKSGLITLPFSSPYVGSCPVKIGTAQTFPQCGPRLRKLCFLGDGCDLWALVPFAHLAHVPQKTISSHLDIKLELKQWLFLGLKPVGLQVGMTTSVLLVLRPSDTDQKDTIGFPGSPIHDSPCRSWDLPPYSHDPVPYNKIYIHILLVLFEEQTHPCLCMLIFCSMWFTQCGCLWVMTTSSQL